MLTFVDLTVSSLVMLIFSLQMVCHNSFLNHCCSEFNMVLMLNVVFLSLSGSFFYSMYMFIVRCCMFIYALILLSVFRLLIVFCRIVNLIFYLIFYSINLLFSCKYVK